MILIVNPLAGGGTAPRKLGGILRDIQTRCGEIQLESCSSPEHLLSIVATQFAAGERRFVAAGGDGSVNALLSALMITVPEAQRGLVCLGAIGLGSSNDFHKPVRPESLIGRIPCTIDFSSTRPRDVAVMEFRSNGATERRYFLINASAGLTAEANRFFNRPDIFLAFLKRSWTDAAILYAVLRTIVTYDNQRLTIETDGGSGVETSVTNLAILKNPHVSGGLRFPGDESYDSGLLQFKLAADLRLGGRIRLLWALASGSAPEDHAMKSWQSRAVTLKSEMPFSIEFDGEVINADCVRFLVLPRHLQVCTC